MACGVLCASRRKSFCGSGIGGGPRRAGAPAKDSLPRLRNGVKHPAARAAQSRRRRTRSGFAPCGEPRSSLAASAPAPSSSTSATARPVGVAPCRARLHGLFHLPQRCGQRPAARAEGQQRQGIECPSGRNRESAIENHFSRSVNSIGRPSLVVRRRQKVQPGRVARTLMRSLLTSAASLTGTRWSSMRKWLPARSWTFLPLR